MDSQEDNQTESVSTLNITLGELVVFINWMQQAEKSMSQGQPLPTAPHLTLGEVNRWVHFVLGQESIIRDLEAKHQSLQETLNAHERQLGSLATDLCEKVARLYENLGQQDKAATVRLRLPGFQSS